MRGAVGLSPLNILYVTAPAKVGGVESVVSTLAQGLQSRGHLVHVAASVAPSGPPHPFVDGLRAASVPVLLTPSGYLGERRAVLAKALKMDRPVVHSHGYRSDVLVRSVRRSLPGPIASTVHGFTGGDRKNRAYEWLQIRALAGFDAVLPVSRALAKTLLDQGIGSERIELLPNGFRPARPLRPRAEARARLVPGVNGPVIGWVGRLGLEKGCDVFLEALALIRNDDWTACIVGTGPERPSLDRLVARLGLESRIVWAGLVPGAAEWFLAFDVLALSSRTEGTPIVVLEAMNAGVPVVATAVGGVPDLLDEGRAGWLVPPLESAALAQSAHEALTDSSLAARRAGLARARAATTYAVEPWLDRYEAMYRRLLDTRPAKVRR